MTNRFLISVAAAALIAGTGFANAQGTGTKTESGGSSQQMHQNAQPSGGAAEHGGSMSREKGTVGQSSGTQSGHEKGTVGQSSGTQTGGTKSGTSAEERSGSSGTMNKSPSAEEKSGATKGQRSDERAQGREGKGATTGQSHEGRTGATENRETGTKMQGESGTKMQGQTGMQGRTGQTTGQAGAGAKLSTEQRTQLTSVIREERVAPVSNVNFSVSVGSRIPREGIELHALPSRVATIYPEWRSYKYVLVRDEIVIIDPETYEIVAVLNA